MNKEVVKILIRQMEQNLAALKALVADEDASDVQEETKSAPKVAPKKPKKNKMKVVNTDDLRKAFGITDGPVDELAEETVVDASTAKPEKSITLNINAKAEQIELPEETEDKTEIDDDEVLARQILSHLNIDDSACSVLRIHKRYYDNNCEKLYIDRWHVVLTLLDDHMQMIDQYVVTWKQLTLFHYQLRQRGIERHTVSDDPHQNWMPKIINLDLG